MADPEPQSPPDRELPAPGRCLLGAAVAGGFAVPLYLLTRAIVGHFANNPLDATGVAATSIGAAVRALLIGGSVLLTGVFAIVEVGLVALAVQSAVQRWRARSQ
jgi:site-specific recombinase